MEIAGWPKESDDLKIRTDIKESVQADLQKGGFADASIVSHINRINEVGFETIASCSGMRKDHHGEYGGAYLSVVLPESVVEPHIFGVHDVHPSKVKDWGYIKRLIKAGHEANWNAELSKYMMVQPVITFYMPETETVGMDAVAKATPELKRAEEKLSGLVGSDSELFLKALHKRDRIRKRVFKEHGARERSDEEIDSAWKRLVKSLIRVRLDLEA